MLCCVQAASLQADAVEAHEKLREGEKRLSAALDAEKASADVIEVASKRCQTLEEHIATLEVKLGASDTALREALEEASKAGGSGSEAVETLRYRLDKLREKVQCPICSVRTDISSWSSVM
jgi:hypothetical protein